MNIDDALADWDGVNGVNGHNGVGDLEEIFEGYGYVFRHFENCQVSYMRWQAGRSVADVVTLSDGSGLLIERFELLAWASTSEQLIDKLIAR
jgi:hypothetical protein